MKCGYFTNSKSPFLQTCKAQCQKDTAVGNKRSFIVAAFRKRHLVQIPKSWGPWLSWEWRVRGESIANSYPIQVHCPISPVTTRQIYYGRETFKGDETRLERLVVKSDSASCNPEGLIDHTVNHVWGQNDSV